ncbi:MAG: hypothetical protein HKN47_23010 [Pirellulaceae bacterium]|nr:hypothetical protein [Pirellulaceae bacterium]
MSTATRASSPTLTSDPGATSSADRLISERIAEACRALWWAEVVRRGLFLTISLIVAVMVWVVVDQWIYSPGVIVRLLAGLAVAGSAVWYVVFQVVPVLTSSVRPEYAARSLERDLPEMKQQLTSYVTLRPDAGTPTQQQDAIASDALHRRVIRSIGSVAAGRLQAHDALPTEATGTLRWWMAAAAALALLAGYTVLSPKSTIASASRLVVPLAAIDPAKRVSIDDVLPGDVEAIAGRSVDISASVTGLRQGESVWCRWESASRENEFELSLNETTQRFEGSLTLSHSASGSIPYTIVAGDDRDGPHWLSVKNLPVVAVQSIHYEPPAYTGEVAHTSSSASISGVEGTKVTILAKTNRPIAKASIQFNPKMLGETVRATAGTKAMKIDSDSMTLTLTFPLRSARGRSSAVQLENYRIQVWDDTNQSNPDPIVYPIRVIADLPPEVSIVLPRKSPKSMGLELQQLIEVHAMDPDFGLHQVELEIRRGIDVIKQPVLWSDEAGAKGNRVTEYRFRPSEHGLRIGDVVQIRAIATDNRSVPDDSTVEPNSSVTDPVELRIVDDQPAPDPQQAEDGLSQPDNRPASDQPQDNAGNSQSADQQGDPQQGGGGGQGESSQQQQGDGQQGDGQSGDSSSGQGDPNQSNTDGPQDQKNGGKGGGKGEPSEGSPDGSGGGDDQAQGSNQTAGDNSQSSKGGQPSQNDPGQSGDPSESMNDSPTDGNGGSESGSTTGQPNDAATQGTDPNQANGNSSGDPSRPPSGDQQGNRAEENTDDAGDNRGGQKTGAGNEGSPSGNTDGGAEENGGPPKHDGEAFEKIRDYIEKKKQQEAKNNSAGQDGQADQSDSANSQSPSDPAKSRQSPAENSDNANSGNSDDTNAMQPPDGSASKGEPSQSNPDSPEEKSGEGSDSTANNPSGNSDNPSGQSPRGADGGPSGDKNSQGARPSDTEPTEDQGGSEKGSPNQEGGDQATDDKAGAEQGAGEKSGGNNDAPNNDAGNNDAGSKGMDDSSQSTGDKGSGDDSQIDKNQSDKNQGDKGNGDENDPSDAESKSGDAVGDDNSSQAGSDNGDARTDGSKQGGNQNSGGPPQDDQSNQQGSPPRDAERPSDRDSSPNSPTGNSQPNAANQDPRNNQSNSQGGNASGSPSDALSGEGADAAPPPAAADLEYTKKATDMVLDYLDETRDEPDRELLDQLDWTQEDLKRFADRWQKTRQMDQGGQDPGQQNKEIQEALESLGLRPPATGSTNRASQAADDLRSIRDSGNRKPPPAAYRDVFDAFRRGLGRQK